MIGQRLPVEIAGLNRVQWIPSNPIRISHQASRRVPTLLESIAVLEKSGTNRGNLYHS